MLLNKIACILALVLALIAVAVETAPTSTRVIIHRNERFCILLPRTPGSDITGNLKQSVSYCSSTTASNRYAKVLPSGFVISANYFEPMDLAYSQVTGIFNPASFMLSTTDDGGMTSSDLPGGAKCHGFKYFVQFVEPSTGLFCLRCCHRKAECPTDKPDKGCLMSIPGVYF